ncbi:MAG: hypothetical protein K2X27_11235 [Candidatus Obscuribacterales bacterium]|nr:hypothetical protein [Candidatus Obscuribacterales bacterium]
MPETLHSALTCLNNWSSFLAFEKLQGSLTHCSRVYHETCAGHTLGLISAWNTDDSPTSNRLKHAELLMELNQHGFKSTQILMHIQDDFPQADPEPIRFFFVTYEKTSVGKKQLLALCNSYGQPAVALTEEQQVRVLRSDGTEIKRFTRETLEVSSLVKMANSISGKQSRWLESGYFDASPIMIQQAFANLGLRSDICSRKKLRERAPNLLRRRPLEIDSTYWPQAKQSPLEK